MKKTILIAPFDGPIAAAIAAEARERGWATAIALADGTKQIPLDKAGESDSVTIPYNPSSFVSVSAMVLQAGTAWGGIDAAVLLCDVTGVQTGFPGDRPGDLGSLVAERCAGPLFLSRELCRRFELRKAGRILLLAPEQPRDAALGPVASLVSGAFEGLANGLFTLSGNMVWSAYGVLDSSGMPERAAKFVLAALEEQKTSRAGRWIRYSGKSGLFGAA